MAAAIVYGSVAAETDRPDSDLDLLVVARDDQREALWSARHEIGTKILGTEIDWAQELPWQRPYRFQAWGDRFAVMLDVTFDEGAAGVWSGLAEGYDVLVDRDGVDAQLRQSLAAFAPDEADLATTDDSVWPWFGYLDTLLRKGRLWSVRADLHQILSTRVLPLFGIDHYQAEIALDAADVRALHDAAPRSDDPGELRRSLKATVALYEDAAGRWSARTGRQRPAHPMAAHVRDRIQARDD